jgi:tetratricopeptide (TPR) repeat protein
MFRKAYFPFILLVAIAVVSGRAAMAQTTAPISGTVEMEGTHAAVAGVTVEAFRTDVKLAPFATKTSKKGEFTFAGLLLGAEYALGVSGPGISPTVYPGVKAGQEHIVVSVSAGDGRKLTEAEIRSASTNPSKAGEPEVSAEEKKQRDDVEAKNAEIMAKNEKMKNADEVARKSNAEGAAALNAGNYDLAIQKYSEGISAVPDFIGSTPILWAGKIAALKNKGHAIYVEGTKLTDPDARKAKYAEANKYYDEALAGFEEALKIHKGAEAPKDANDQKQRDNNKLILYSLAVDVHRIKAVSLVDSTKADQAAPIFAEYLTIETDPAKRLAAQTALGDVMRLTYNYDKAAAAYKAALELKPDHAEAMAGLGLSLFAEGAAATPEDKEKEQEGLNYMQKYIDTSPVSPTDPASVAELKKSVKDTIDYLKNEKKLAPQKVATPVKKRP